MQRILAAGDEIGNHSFHHPVDPGAAELASTNEATGFESCLFRPPYGEVDPKVTAAARADGLELVLRARGFRCVTVTELLGGRTRYRP
jgi:peptidoglycan/xylan/chitin deacetylase (PgdA/CDA1 family)